MILWGSCQYHLLNMLTIPKFFKLKPDIIAKLCSFDYILLYHIFHVFIMK